MRKLFRDIQKGLIIYGDNLEGMELLLQVNQRVDMIYIDPPFQSNSTYYYAENKTSHIGGNKDSVVAYSDKMTHTEYLEFMKQRFVLMRELLSNEGTLHVHIDVKMGAYIHVMLDELFGRRNFVNEIARVKTKPKNFNSRSYGNIRDTILIYAKDHKQNIFNNITEKTTRHYNMIDKHGRRFTTTPCHAPGVVINGPTSQPWGSLMPPEGRHWRMAPEKLEELNKCGRIYWTKNGTPRLILYEDEHTECKIQDVWTNFYDPQRPIYPTEKNSDMLDLIVKQSSNENSLIMDCFCGSGSLLAAGRRNNRRVIGIDQSPIALKVLRTRPELKDIPIVNI